MKSSSLHNTSGSTAVRHPMSRLLPKRPEGPMRVPARLLGWFSIALGLAEMAAPRALARGSGAGESRHPLVRAYGAREIGVGVGLLSSRNPAPWLWARVAGDALDIATVLPSLSGPRAGRAAVTLAALVGVAAIDLACAMGAGTGRRRQAVKDYRDRSGFPKRPQDMRGVAAQRKAA